MNCGGPPPSLIFDSILPPIEVNANILLYARMLSLKFLLLLSSPLMSLHNNSGGFWSMSKWTCPFIQHMENSGFADMSALDERSSNHSIAWQYLHVYWGSPRDTYTVDRDCKWATYVQSEKVTNQINFIYPGNNFQWNIPCCSDFSCRTLGCKRLWVGGWRSIT